MSTERSALFSKQQPRAGFLNWGYLPVTKEIVQAAFQRHNLSKQNMIINSSYGYKLRFKKIMLLVNIISIECATYTRKV